jgi:hypothetical protein
MQQEKDRTDSQNDYPKTQPQDAASMDASQQGTRQHGAADGDRERWGDDFGGDPNQRGTHGHPADEHLRQGSAQGFGGDLQEPDPDETF